MNKTILPIVLALVCLLALTPSPGKADPALPKVDIPFGTLVRGSSCAAATHILLSPCFPYPPQFFVVFPQGKNVARYEGQNVTMHVSVDRTSCALPLLLATKVSLSDSVPPCPPPEG